MTTNKNVSTGQHDGNMNSSTPNTSFFSRNWAIILISGVIGFYLVTEHTAHLLGALPWLILLACPLIHVFMHRGHGGHDHTQPHQKEVNDE